MAGSFSATAASSLASARVAAGGVFAHCALPGMEPISTNSIAGFRLRAIAANCDAASRNPAGGTLSKSFMP